jgi:hypothetical protein
MTLDTTVYLDGPVDVHALFRTCQSLVGSSDTVEWTDESVGEWYGDGVWELGNRPGQGLCALLDLQYRPSGEPLVSDADAGKHDEDCEPGCTYHHAVACYARVSFDTAYGYRDDEGRDCNQLHVRLVSELGKVLDAEGVGWRWKNEYTGEIHAGHTGYAGLIGSGDQAQAWYRDKVVPALQAMGGVTHE